MGKSNTAIRQWLSDKERLSNLVNGCLFSGKQIFTKEHLTKEDGTQGIIIHTKDGKEIHVERYRDISMFSDDGTRIVLLACENQEEIHYGMPVRGMLYDALTYVEQIRDLQKEHRRENELEGSAEFLSGLKKTDMLCPVITIVFYYGEKPWDGSKDLHGLLGLEREEYRLLKEYVPNYRINLINPAEIEDLSSFEQNLQMVFGMLKYRKDKIGLKSYLDMNKEYFANIDEDTYQAAKTMISAGHYLKDIKSENENGGMNMCKALEDLYQEGIDIGKEQERERGITILIETCNELQISYSETLQKVQKKFELSREEAEQALEKHWKNSEQ